MGMTQAQAEMPTNFSIKITVITTYHIVYHEHEMS
jgi:hypothetical protein